MSRMDYSGSGANQETDHQQSITLPGYVPYISLVFKLTATPIILLLSGWVVYTIKTTRHLHKPHNIFVANLLVAGMLTTLIDCFMSSSMIISFALGVEFFIGCYTWRVRLAPLHVINLSFVIIAVDKLIAMVYIKTYPFKYKKIMTPRVVVAVISGSWVIAAIPTAWTMIFHMDGVLEVPQYGTCFFDGNAFIEAVIIFLVPMAVASILTIVLNVLFAKKSYQVHMQIKRETNYETKTEQSDKIRSLRKKQYKNKEIKKSIITVFVVVLGSAVIPLLTAVFHIGGRFFIESQLYQDVMEYVIVANIGYVMRFFHPLAYGIYFNPIREPMVACWKRFVRMENTNSVTP